MRTTVTIDDDVAAVLEAERRRTGESFRQVLNRLVRRAVQRDAPGDREQPVPLPVLPGRPRIDIRDVSAVLAELEDEHIQAKRLY